MEQNHRNGRGDRVPQWLKWLAFALTLVLVAAVAVAVGGLLSRNAPQDKPAKKVSYEVEVTLFGDSEIILEFGQQFMDPGAVGQWWSTDAPKTKTNMEVEVQSDLNPDVLGEYKITYTAEYKGQKVTKTRTVKIVDTKAPEITLVTDPDKFTLPGEAYQEEGFTATDNYDGDITDKVQRREEDGKVTYTVKDSSGNEATVVREIVYGDDEAPKLTLKGDKKVTISAGMEWSDPGCTASDNVDGNLTSKIKVSGSVITYRAGTYELVYEVTDSHGNKSTLKRTVVVEPLKRPEVVDPGEKVIYLTFDDGPSKYTTKLLGILEKYDVNATFFVVKTVDVALLKDIADAGHAIGMHSVSHDYNKIYKSDEAFLNDLYAMQDIIFQYTGQRPTLMRFPGGSSNRVSLEINKGIMTRLTKQVQDLGFTYVDWNTSSGDAGETKNTDKIAQNVISGIKKNGKKPSVVLQHDIYGYSVNAVEQIIVWGLANGYTFKVLDETSPVCHHKVMN